MSFSLSGNAVDQKRGEELISSGKIASLILAGGSGSRLGFSGPKGTYPVTPFQHKSFFQLILERIKSASQRARVLLPVAIMTSPANRDTTQHYLEANCYFGLDKDQVFLFEQKLQPLLDVTGEPFFLESGAPALGPDGNGRVCSYLVESGICSAWRSSGIQEVLLIPIDNILADPFDSELCGYHERMGNEITLKAIETKDPKELLGRISKESKGLRVFEYSELSEEQRGSLQYAYSGLLSFSLSFIEKMAGVELPVHLAHKKMFEKMVHKQETFIFDLLEYTTKSSAHIYPREEIFAPIKCSQDIPSALQLLFAFNRQVFYQVSGVLPPKKAFELDAAFYYPTEALIKKWKGRELPDKEYITVED